MNIMKYAQAIVEPKELEKRLLAYAKIDYIMNQDEEDYKVYHYDDKNWLTDGNYIRIDDSGGDHYHVLISEKGSIIKGFDHECELSPYNFEEDEMPAYIKRDPYQGCPSHLKEIISDAALEAELFSFVVWQDAQDTNWKFYSYDIPENYDDGIETFLLYTADITYYKEWFEEYYEINIDVKWIEAIYHNEKITKEIILAINEEADAAAILLGLEGNF